MHLEHPFDVAVIGAGASGTLLASNYSRYASPGARMTLISAGDRPGHWQLIVRLIRAQTEKHLMQLCC